MTHDDYEYDYNDLESRPSKRPRQLKEGDGGHRPFIAMSGASGVHSEGDGGSEGPAKKGRKRPLSCGECRRLKLKCDRVFPCQSCCKRGCAEICPEGALTGGKGSRFILANTEQLHEKIKMMSERIRTLEEGLGATHSQHPLLRPELLLIKKSPELFGIEQHHQAPPSDGSPDAQSRHDDLATDRKPRTNDDHVRSGSVDSSRDSDEPQYPSTAASSLRHQDAALSEEIARLSRSFPSPWSISYELDLNMRQRIRDMLPSRAEAQYLCDQACRNAFWQFNVDASETFLPNLIHSVYTTHLPVLLPHRLGLFLMILAIGCVVDLKQGPDRKKAEQYHYLARAALCEVPVMDDTSFDAVNALFFMEWYLLMFSDHKRAAEYAWGITGLATKLAHTIALHRDGVRSKVIPEELDKRRTLFWDLMGTDARLALMLRRPPSINMRHVDAKQPSFSYDDTPDAQYHQWQYSFLAQCVIPVLDAVITPQPPSYSDILGLDSKIRNFDAPPSLQMIDNDDGVAPNHPLAMQQGMTTCARETALLQLHKSYFTQALLSNENFTVKHKYAPSVLAVYSSACNLIWAVRTLYLWEPELSTRFAVIWSNCFSAACALCFLVSRAPSLPLAPYVLQELDKLTTLFTEVRDHCPSVPSYLAVLDKFIARSREHYMNWRSGVQAPHDEMTDEICVLVRRIVPAVGDGQAGATNNNVTDPFELAHPYLRRRLEQASAADPCVGTNSLHLTRIRGPVGTVLHAQSDVRSYSAPTEATRPSSGSTTGYQNPWSDSSREAHATSVSSAGMLGSDIADSSWMSWW